MTSKPILYGSYTSPGVNAVRITLKALNVAYEFREVKTLQNENRTAEYLRKNPSGTIPVLETEEHQFIGDSHAIAAYLVDRYGKDDSLYPRELYKRAKVQQLQHFADTVLFISCAKPAFGPLFARVATTVPEEVLKRFDEAFVMMERFLSANKWMAGDQLTIADFSCICCTFTMFYFRPFTEESHPILSNWFQRMMSMPYVFETLTNDAIASSLRFLSKTVSKL